MDDIERAFDDAVSTFKNTIKDQRFLPGAGATEIYLAEKLEQEGQKLKGLEQYSFHKYGQAFEHIPRILSDNCGLNTTEILTQLRSLSNQKPHGLDVNEGKVVASSELDIYDHLMTKYWAIKLASDAAITVLRVD